MTRKCANCGGEMRMTAAACGGAFDSYHEYECPDCWRQERDGWGPTQIRYAGRKQPISDVSLDETED